MRISHTVVSARSWRARSGGGGMHLLFRYPEGIDLALPKAMAPGIEVIADNRQLVVVPSMHLSGRAYQWENNATPWEIDLPELPHWILLRWLKPAEPVRQPWRNGPFDMAGFIDKTMEFPRCPFADRRTTGPGGADLGVHGSDALVAGCLHHHRVGRWNFKTLREMLKSLHGAAT